MDSSTLHESSSPVPEESSSWTTAQIVVIGIFLSMMMLTNIVGNILTIIAFVKDKKLQIVQNMYVVNLAVTDLIIGVVSLPFSTIYTFYNYVWPFTSAVCKVYVTLDYWACAESSLTIILISYDRLLMVRDGIKYNQQQSKKRALVRITVTWILSFLLYGPAVIGYDIWRGYSTLGETECYVEFTTESVFLLITSSLDFFIPFFLLTVCNSMLYWNIRQRSHKIAVSTSQSSSADRVTRLNKDKKAAKSLALLVLVYAMCWSPFKLYTIISAATGYEGGPLLYESSAWFLWLNSSLNPVCYAVTNLQFRKQYKRLMCMCCVSD